VNMVRADDTGDRIAAQPGGQQQGGQGGNASRALNAAAAGAAIAGRWRQVITGNAQRMARRLAAGQLVSAEVLADALAITPEQAADWMAKTMRGGTEENYTAALAELALKDAP
jgi:hypothetical protein